MIPVIGLVVTVLTQQRSDTPQTSPPPGHAPTAAPPASPPAEPDASADEDTAKDSPSPSPSKTAPAVLRSGTFALEQGGLADLEHGTAGKSVESPDMSWSGNDSFSALNGRVASSLTGATPTTCADLIRDHSLGMARMAPAGSWFCLPTSAGHVAGLEYLGPGEGGRRQFHYIVWDMTAPSG
ncbi:hypothetical protein ACFVFH_19970 [Streptomyces sp. NPDC057697]|uniref:hypothetical protein n=1 Tax=Streptomyces sp. NPDC057697 TaxID=3346219 RepID=UPI0036ABB4B8